MADEERLTYNVKEVAAILGVGVTKVREECDAGHIPHLRFAGGRGRVVIPKGPFHRWLDAQAEASLRPAEEARHVG